jgi:hypothetical protein
MLTFLQSVKPTGITVIVSDETSICGRLEMRATDWYLIRLAIENSGMAAKFEKVEPEPPLPTITGCPACAVKRRHTAEDWAHHQPGAGHSLAHGAPPASPDLEEKS